MFRMFTAAAFASLLAVVAAPADAALTHNSMIGNALTNNALANNSLLHNAMIGNALTATGSGLADLNGVAVEAVVLPHHSAK